MASRDPEAPSPPLWGLHRPDVRSAALPREIPHSADALCNTGMLAGVGFTESYSRPVTVCRYISNRFSPAQEKVKMRNRTKGIEAEVDRSFAHLQCHFATPYTSLEWG